MSLNEIFRELRAQYLEEFPLKLQSLKELLHKKDAESLLLLFHRLKGTGKTYGFDEVSIIAQKLEDHLRQIAKTPQDPHWIGIEKSLMLLERYYLAVQEQKSFDLNQDPDFLFIKINLS